MTVGKFRGPLGRASTRRGTWRFTAAQSSTVGLPQAGGVGDGGHVDEQVGGAAECRVSHHRVADRSIGEKAAHDEAAALEIENGAGGAAGHVEPDGVSRGRQRRVRERHSEGLADNLGGGGGAKKVAASAGRGAGAAAGLGGIFERDGAVGEPGADGLDLGRILPLFGH